MEETSFLSEEDREDVCPNFVVENSPKEGLTSRRSVIQWKAQDRLFSLVKKTRTSRKRPTLNEG